MSEMTLATVAYRVGAVERALDEHDKRVGRTMENVAVHEEQINGDRGISHALTDLTKEVRDLNELLRKELDDRAKRLWQLASATLVAFFGGVVAAYFAAGAPHP